MIRFDQSCSECGKPVPVDLITCPSCAADKDATAQRQAQIPLVARALAGEIEICCYRGDDGRRHIRKWHFGVTFCGLPCVAARAGSKRVSYLWLDQDKELSEICGQCLIEFNLLGEEARHASA